MCAFQACDDAERRRDCSSAIWVPTALGKDARVIASWSGWKEPGEAPEPYDDAYGLLRVELPPGEHSYLLRGDDGDVLDPANPLSSFRPSDEREVSLLIVPDCSAPLLAVDAVTTKDGTLTISGRFLAGSSFAKLDPTTLAVASEDGTVSLRVTSDPDAGTWSASGAAPDGKTVFLPRASDLDGAAAEAPRTVAFPARKAASWDDDVIYQVVIDRFRGDDGAALAPPATPGSRAGGTLSGVRAAIESGTFDELGVTTLWLSPVYTNPSEARPGVDGHDYEAYHGYWPLAGREVDPRIGGEDALHAVVDAAHARGMKVLLDLVPNHVYEDNPLYAERKADAWFNPDDCVCGTESCPWSGNIQSCWFTPYLPDFHFQTEGTMTHAAADARFWLETFDVDGFRIDAVPMMPRAVTRRIAYDLASNTAPRDSFFLVGEVFTGPGSGPYGQLRGYLGGATLDSVFDFPLMWAARGAIASGTGSFEEIDALLGISEEAFAGSGATVARMLDNHDTPRFISVATGDAFNDPWANPPLQPGTEDPYLRVELGLALLFTLPGAPTLFYGDELGLAGANDPDARRVMPADDALLDVQRALRDDVAALSRLRACSTALRRGERTTLHVANSSYAFERATASGERALVLLNASTDPASLPAGELPEGTWLDALTGESISIGATDGVPLPRLSYRVLVQPGDPCAAPAL